jgi:acetamidase/formamidase
VRPGNAIHLPVAVPGACLYVGDVHGSMGDGELYGVGNETRAELTLSCQLDQGRTIPFPRIETDDSIIQLNSSRPLDDAIADAFGWMLDWLVTEHGLQPRDAYVLLGVHPDVRVNVYQMIKLGRLNYTVGVAFPKAALP